MNSLSTPKYRYAPLPGYPRGYIRLLRLDTRLDGEATLTGSLILHSLPTTEPGYTSLSYSWGRNSDGDPSLSRSILLDGCALAITENLYDCLIQLSEPGAADAQLLWIDAICIDQANVMERGDQVEIMDSIYQSASNLVIWLGHGARERRDQEAIDALSMFDDEKLHEPVAPDYAVLKDLSPKLTGLPMSESKARRLVAACTMGTRDRHCMFHSSPNPSTVLRWLGLVRLAFTNSSAGDYLRRNMTGPGPKALLGQLDTDTCIFAAIGPELIDSLLVAVTRLFGALITLCRRRYFARRWIVQEIFHSVWSKAILRWGSFSIQLSRFRYRLSTMSLLLGRDSKPIYAQGRAYADVKDSLERYAQSYNAAAGILYIEQSLSEEYPHDNYEKILYCLQNFQYTACADDRDRLYAFGSIAGTYSPVSTDYHLSASEVFVAFALKLVEQHALGQLLYIASWQWTQNYSGTSLNRAAELPSWVPDLRCALPEPGEYARRTMRETKFHQASGVFPGEARVLSFLAKFGRLKLSPFKQSSNETLRRLRKDDFICQIDQDTEVATGFLLTPSASCHGTFILTGYWVANNRLEEDVWDHCTGVGSKVIRLS